MRTTDEKMQEILLRTDKLRKDRLHKEKLLFGVGTAVFAAFLLLAIGNIIPLLPKQVTEDVPVYYGAMIANNPLIGFTIVVILAFVLGISCTLLVIRLRESDHEVRRNNHESHHNSEDGE